MKDDTLRPLFDLDAIERIEREGKILFINPSRPSWMVSNSHGEEVLKLCDGSRTCREVIDVYCARNGEEWRDVIEVFLEEAIGTNIFAGESDNAPHRRKLSLVQFSISQACNLHCVYCYATDRREHGARQMQLADYKRVIDGLVAINPDVSFTLTGGEPLLNRDCLAIAQYIVDCGCGVDLLTNGSLIGEGNIDDIARLFYKVTVSSDGSTPELFESFRGKGQYSRIHRAIGLLEEHGVDYTISMVVNKKNIHDVQAMAHKWGGHLNYQPLFRAGEASGKDDLSISGNEYYDVLKAAHGVNPLSYCESSLDAALDCKNCKCAIADAEISISATGDVYPCQLLHYREFLAGNIYEQDIRDIYYNSPVLESCRRLTVDNLEGCKTCFLRYVCGGACRARAYHECGDIHSSSDFCDYEKRAFVDGIFSLYSHNRMTE